MSDKKISELSLAKLQEHKDYYVLAARDGENYKVNISDVIDESKKGIVVPTKVSDLTNDAGYINIIPGEYITETELNERKYITSDNLLEYAKKSDIPEIPDIPTKVSELENDVKYITEDVLNAKNYATKQDIPEIPTKVSQLENDSKYATESYVTTAISNAQLGEEEIDLSEYAKKSEIPTKTSQLINDSGFVNEDQVLELIGSTTPEIPSSPSAYSIINNLTNVNNSNSVTQINKDSEYTATISPYAGYKLSSVTITMGGVDITSQIYADNYISIPSVTGNIVITAIAILDLPEPEDKTIWAYKNDDFTTHRSADTSVTTAHIELTGTNYTSRVDQVLQWFPNCVNIVLFSDGTVNTLNGMFGVGNQNSRSLVKTVAFESEHFEGVVDMSLAFKHCTALESITTSLPSSVQLLNETFYGCSKLVTVPDLSDNVTEMEYTFMDCTSLTTGPMLSGSVQIMHGTYSNCKCLETAYMSLTQKDGTSLCLDQIFDGCACLTDVILVGTATKSLWIYEMFEGVPESTVQKILRDMIPEHLGTVSNGRVLYLAAYGGTDYSTYLTEEELSAAISKGWVVSARQ